MAVWVKISDLASTRLNGIATVTGQPVLAVVDEAVGFLHRSLIGDPDVDQMHIPFKKLGSQLDAEVLLRQIDPTNFHLEEPFRYRPNAGDDVLVPRGDVTDLASVPAILTWLVPRYGRHTLPALLHDHVVEDGMAVSAREAADRTFRDAMGATKVPFIRRWMMWTAVSLITQLGRPWRRKVPVLAWIVLHIAIGVDLLGWVGWGGRVPILSAFPPPLLAATPLVLSALWVHRYRMGLISGLGLVILPLSVLSVLVTLGIYLFAEGVAELYLKVRDEPVNPVRLSRL